MGIGFDAFLSYKMKISTTCSIKAVAKFSYRYGTLKVLLNIIMWIHKKNVNTSFIT